MRQAIGDVLPLAIAAAISPIPIIGVVLMLVTPRARVNGPSFVVGWLFGLVVVGVIGLTVASAAGASDDGASSSGADTFQIVLGVLLLVLAIRHWRRRPGQGEEPPLPKWMSAVDDFSPGKAAAAGFVFSAVNPKNLVLTLAAATTIASTALPGGDQAVVFAVYAVLASIGVVAPVVVAFTAGARAAPVLAGMRVWLARHNAAIMAVILLVIGAKVLGQGIAG